MIECLVFLLLIHMAIGFATTYMQSVPITSNIVSSNPDRRGVLDTTL